jgi:hypothetical protein
MLPKDEKPMIVVRRITAIADKRDAIAQTIVDRRFVGMPRSCARSPFSAAARIATP